jgi:hypothetical protein
MESGKSKNEEGGIQERTAGLLFAFREGERRWA